MKVTHDDVIRNGEQELIDGITADLDWEAVEALFREKHHLPLGEDVAYKNGDLVVHENRIAYLLEFEVKVPLAMLLDRQGHCIRIQSEGLPSGMEETSSETGQDAEPIQHEPPESGEPEVEAGAENTFADMVEVSRETEDLQTLREAEGDADAGLSRMALEAQEAFARLGRTRIDMSKAPSSLRGFRRGTCDPPGRFGPRSAV